MRAQQMTIAKLLGAFELAKCRAEAHAAKLFGASSIYRRESMDASIQEAEFHRERCDLNSPSLAETKSISLAFSVSWLMVTSAIFWFRKMKRSLIQSWQSPAIDAIQRSLMHNALPNHATNACEITMQTQRSCLDDFT